MDEPPEGKRVEGGQLTGTLVSNDSNPRQIQVSLRADRTQLAHQSKQLFAV
jgi:hypothetical protein